MLLRGWLPFLKVEGEGGMGVDLLETDSFEMSQDVACTDCLKCSHLCEMAYSIPQNLQARCTAVRYSVLGKFLTCLSHITMNFSEAHVVIKAQTSHTQTQTNTQYSATHELHSCSD